MTRSPLVSRWRILSVSMFLAMVLAMGCERQEEGHEREAAATILASLRADLVRFHQDAVSKMNALSNPETALVVKKDLDALDTYESGLEKTLDGIRASPVDEVGTMALRQFLVRVDADAKEGVHAREAILGSILSGTSKLNPGEIRLAKALIPVEIYILKQRQTLSVRHLGSLGDAAGHDKDED